MALPRVTTAPPPAAYAVLDNRVGGVEKAVNKLEGEFVRLETNMAQSFRSLENSVAALSSSMQGELNKRDKPQWQVIIAGIGVLLTFFVITGGLVYAPIKAQLDSLDKQIGGTGGLNDRITDVHNTMRRDFRAELKSIDGEKIDRREVDLLTRYRDLQSKHNEDRMDRIERAIDKVVEDILRGRKPGDGK